MNKTVLVLGITGQDGSYLAHSLLVQGYRVIGITRKIDKHSVSNLETLSILDQVVLIESSYLDIDNIEKLIHSNDISIIFNLAGISSVGGSFAQPYDAHSSILFPQLLLLELIRTKFTDIKLVYAGSIECLDSSYGPISEKSPIKVTSPYSSAKAAALMATKTYRDSYKLLVSSAILSNHESSLRPETFVVQKIVANARRIANGETARFSLGNTDIARDWGWAPEYVEALVLMLKSEKPNDYIVASGRSISLQHIISLVSEISGVQLTEFIDRSPELIRPNETIVKTTDPSFILQELGWSAKIDAQSMLYKMYNQQLF